MESEIALVIAQVSSEIMAIRRGLSDLIDPDGNAQLREAYDKLMQAYCFLEEMSRGFA